MMQRAIELSRLGFPAPNPHVGCVIAQGDEIVGEGYHEYAGGPHAEVNALHQAGTKASGATAYVSQEPCNHHGRTPPCVDALLAAGIRRVVAAVADPYAPAKGGLLRLAENGVETELGLLQEEAREANVKWLTAVERGYPYVVLKAAMTLDGRIATPSGESKWITGEAARTEAHRLRAECGAVLIGRGTAEKDNPSLTVRHVEARNQPTRILLDPGRKIPNSAQIFDSKAPTLRVVCDNPAEGELQVNGDRGAIDLVALLRSLYARGVTSLLVEGGAHTLGRFLEAGLADRLELFIAPKTVGAGPCWLEREFDRPLSRADSFQFSSFRQIGDDLWATLLPRRS